MTVLDVLGDEALQDNARHVGAHLKTRLEALRGRQLVARDVVRVGALRIARKRRADKLVGQPALAQERAAYLAIDLDRQADCA